MQRLHYEGAEFLRQRLLLATLTGTPIRISNIRSEPPVLATAPAAVNDDAAASIQTAAVADAVVPPEQLLPGVRAYEASLLRLLCKVTRGSTVHIDASGCTLTYTPGQLIGTAPDELLPLSHACHPDKAISYYLEVLLLLAPFCKYPLSIKLTGVTDPSPAPLSGIAASPESVAECFWSISGAPVDYLRYVTIPTLHRLLSAATASPFGSASTTAVETPAAAAPSPEKRPFYTLTVVRRGIGRDCSGVVLLRCSSVMRNSFQPFKLVHEGRVKHIRGTAFAAEGLSPLLAKRCITRVRQLFHALLPDVWVYLEKQQPAAGGMGNSNATTRQLQQQKQQQANCIGLALTAETIKGFVKGAAGICLLSPVNESSSVEVADLCSTRKDDLEQLLYQQQPQQRKNVTAEEVEGVEAAQSDVSQKPERLGEAVAWRLLLEVQQGGIVDSSHQYMALLFSALAEENGVSKVQLSRLTPYTAQFARHLRDFLGVVFHYDENSDDGEVTSGALLQALQPLFKNNTSITADNKFPKVVTLSCVGVGLANLARKTF